MVYSKDEKEKMDLLLEAFQSFIREQDYFDIVYSEKLGYLRILPGGDLADDQVFRIPDSDALLQTLVDDMLFERMHPDPTQDPSPKDFEEIRQICIGKLCFTAREKQRCINIIDTCMETWKKDTPA